jgi:hypothetical protein
MQRLPFAGHLNEQAVESAIIDPGIGQHREPTKTGCIADKENAVRTAKDPIVRVNVHLPAGGHFLDYGEGRYGVPKRPTELFHPQAPCRNLGKVAEA